MVTFVFPGEAITSMRIAVVATAAGAQGIMHPSGAQGNLQGEDGEVGAPLSCASAAAWLPPIFIPDMPERFEAMSHANPLVTTTKNASNTLDSRAINRDGWRIMLTI